MFRHAFRSVSRVALIVAIVSVPTAALGQGVPRTSWGHADLQGTWSTATITPFERPAELAGKEFLTREEAAEFERLTLERGRIAIGVTAAPRPTSRAPTTTFGGTAAPRRADAAHVACRRSARRPVPPLTPRRSNGWRPPPRRASNAGRPTIPKTATCGSAASRAACRP